ncbi:hypothetical protein [Bacillus sp. Au-Bac7]|uniref:hypothetical protein n=1 Tax=Bacillus sp. Au-Bac7 TaxID=2906458 RepID=UPI001E40BB94|nr:hypothetical protein [Bacillus sp. Au-Bac7]MCE4048978.1 hypothetical protein [Bacillus sp. Au-Bac7]
MADFSSETEKVHTIYRFLSEDEMKGKSSSLNNPLDDVLDDINRLDNLLKDELGNQSGAISKKIEEEWNNKAKKAQTSISHIKEENQSHVQTYRNIAEELRTQEITLYYKRMIPSF